VGYLLLRSRERVKLEEQAASELRKLRVNALVRFVDAVGEYASAKANMLGMKAYCCRSRLMRPQSRFSLEQRDGEWPATPLRATG
jgi:hypothetical protein